MMKHLFIYPWILALLLLGIGVCIAMALHTLLIPPQASAVYPDAVLVMETLSHALA